MSGAAYKAARAIVDRVRSIEKPTTALIKGVVASTGGSMVGLKYRVKTLASLARKIHNKSVERKQEIDFTATKIPDALRYTAVFSTRGYSAGIRKTLNKMMKEGYEVEVGGKKVKEKFEIDELETHWKRGDAYNGVHAILKHPNGTKLELQFHTPASFKAKMKTHKMYEEFRKPSTPPAERKRLIEEMVRIADSAEVPAGALKFGVQVFRPAEEA